MKDRISYYDKLAQETKQPTFSEKFGTPYDKAYISGKITKDDFIQICYLTDSKGTAKHLLVGTMNEKGNSVFVLSPNSRISREQEKEYPLVNALMGLFPENERSNLIELNGMSFRMQLPPGDCFEIVTCAECPQGWGLQEVDCPGGGGGGSIDLPWNNPPQSSNGSNYNYNYNPNDYHGGNGSSNGNTFGGTNDGDFDNDIYQQELQFIQQEFGLENDNLIFTPEQVHWLAINKINREKMKDFIQANNSSEEAFLYIKEAINLMELDQLVKFDRLEELFNILANNPNALIENCFEEEDEHQIEFWNDLINFDIPQECNERLEDLGDNWDNQAIDSDYPDSKTVNLDYYSIRIITMPDLTGDDTPATVSEFSDYFKANFSAISHEDAPFTPLTSTDSILWASDNSVTTIFTIDIGPTSFLGDDGSVICSQDEGCCWIFSTIKTPNWSFFDNAGTGINDGAHPVSGNRQFGYSDNGDGSYTFYTKGADRANIHDFLKGISFWGFIPEITEEQEMYNGGADLWRGFMDNLEEEVTNGGGTHEPWQETTRRPKTDIILDLIRSSTPIISVPCNQ